MIKALTRNLGLKLFSVAAAFALWLAFSGARELTMSMSVPVQYRNIPKDLEISSNIVEQVHLVLRGPAPLLSRLTVSQVPVVLDLGKVKRAGTTTFTISRANLAMPSGIVLERAVPSQIQIGTDLRVMREVPVMPRFENVPAGMQVASCSVDPARMTVVGAKKRVELIESVATDAVDLSELGQDGTVKTTVFSGDAQVNFLTSPTVTLRVVLTPAAGKK